MFPSHFYYFIIHPLVYPACFLFLELCVSWVDSFFMQFIR
jgi:hypothetical protein